MSYLDDWKFCLIVAVFTLVIMIFTGDVIGLVFFPLWYYGALVNFSKSGGFVNES